MRPKALLLAGGLGIRLRPITLAMPKCMVRIGTKDLLDHWIDALVTAGIRDAIINTHHLAHMVRARVGFINARSSLHLEESHEPQLLGSAGTITANSALADDASAVVVIYADNLSDVALAPLLRFHRRHGDAVSMLLFHAPDPRACGLVTLDAGRRVIEFDEKPAAPKTDLANAGVYVFDPVAFREIADLRAFDLGADVLPRFVGRMRGFVHAGYHRDIGTLAGLERARRDVREGRLSAALKEPASA